MNSKLKDRLIWPLRETKKNTTLLDIRVSEQMYLEMTVKLS